MQIVIDIPKEVYEEIQTKFLNTKVNNITLIDRAIYNGTSLPEGHGGLIDADELTLQIAELSGNILNPCYGVTYSDIKNAPVVIKADKESEVQE